MWRYQNLLLMLIDTLLGDPLSYTTCHGLTEGCIWQFYAVFIYYANIRSYVAPIRGIRKWFPSINLWPARVPVSLCRLMANMRQVSKLIIQFRPQCNIEAILIMLGGQTRTECWLGPNMWVFKSESMLVLYFNSKRWSYEVKNPKANDFRYRKT